MKRVNQRVLCYPLPDNPAPQSVACYSVYVPDDDQHRQLFMSALRTLARWDSYQRDEERRGAATAATWRNVLDDFDFDPCGGGDEDEDTLADDFESLADGVMSMSQAGGVVKAIGYAIAAAGEFIVNTALPVVAVTLLAIGAAYVVSLVVGGLAIGSVAVAAGETVEVIFATGATASNVVEFVATMALAA